jgi:hypothetical protein
MSDRTCPKCNLVFKFPSILKAHFKNSFHCVKSDEEIETYMTENIIPKDIIYNNIKCDYCNTQFSQISSLNRHNKDSKCAKNIKDSDKKIRKEEFINQIKILDPKLAKKIEKLFNKDKDKEEKEDKETNKDNKDKETNKYNKDKEEIIKEKENNKETNKDKEEIIKEKETKKDKIIKIINNNTTNIETQNNINNIINQTNNTITIQHINPFGLEDVRTISISEMINILNSGENAGLHIIKTIYNKLENKNFYKPNISRSEIACLNEDFNLTIYKTREFADALFDRCIAFLHHMLFICKKEITLNNIKKIYENIENIENTMRTEIYDKKLQNIIEAEVRNNNLETKNKISKYIKDIKEIPTIYNDAKNKLKDVKELSLNSNNEYKITLSDKEFNEKLCNPTIALGLSEEDIKLDMILNRFENTLIYKFWKNRILLEQNFINDNNYNDGKILISDIINENKRIIKINKMLDIMKTRHDRLNPGDYINLTIS